MVQTGSVEPSAIAEERHPEPSHRRGAMLHSRSRAWQSLPRPLATAASYKSKRPPGRPAAGGFYCSLGASSGIWCEMMCFGSENVRGWRNRQIFRWIGSRTSFLFPYTIGRSSKVSVFMLLVNLSLFSCACVRHMYAHVHCFNLFIVLYKGCCQ